ncbi:calcium/proton exchanger [Mytilinidion resinicola]|uniref:Vacuolar calcium ion transporter n=1 Tax=Mytilinidion resinicola TaxID=574789 RepID=A0A6A6YXV7_9PEZI|nr:calcium/proton exchanger [Mytilinidion resinicola]KAF2812767.1 calcium/proton exchanger [Mytilinidion resinicola]
MITPSSLYRYSSSTTSTDHQSIKLLAEEARTTYTAHENFSNTLLMAARLETDHNQPDTSARLKEALDQNIPATQQFRAVLFGSWINMLLILVPIGFAVNYSHINSIAVFIINFVAILPLAAMLSYATEELALRTGETLGGLLNASFGNAVELIVSIQALFKNKILIVKTSLIGSMLSNLLLVLGMCFFFGGISRLEQFFNLTLAQTATSLLAICISGLIIPTVFHYMLLVEDTNANFLKNQELSHGTALIMLIIYFCYLFFQLKSHAMMYKEPSKRVEKRNGNLDKGTSSRTIVKIGAITAASAVGTAQINFTREEDIEESQLTLSGALIPLGISTTLIAFCSEFMVNSIQSITEGDKVSAVFVGLILIPIVGNAAEHATAVTMAIKDQMDLAISVAVGSSMQIALFILPLIVIVGWVAGKECMMLYFNAFQIAILFMTILLVN